MSTAPLLFFPPKPTRTHEVCGSGAYVFAFVLAAQLDGQVLLVREHWQPMQFNPDGFAAFFDPGRLITCNAADQLEVLAVAEEALRSGAVSLVIMLLSKPLGLTEGRRLQLAAREGQATGLSILSEEMGSNAAETRWRCTPVFDDAIAPLDSTGQRWELIRNKSGTIGSWYVRWDRASRRLCVVSPPRK